MQKTENRLQRIAYNRFSVFILFLTLCSYCLAQVDSTYIGSFEQPYSVQVYSASNFMALNHEIGNDSEGTTYMSNAPFALGLGASWGKSSFGFSYGFNFMRNRKKGNTKTNSLAFQYRYYGQKFIADLIFQDYKGLYVEDEKKDETYYLYPDIHIKQYAALWQYIFNNKKFSYRAAFNQTERQLKSAGSFQLGGGIYYNRLKVDTTFVLNEKRKINNIQLGINGGYTHTWVIKKNYYISGSISAGVNVGTEYISKFNLDNIKVYPNIYPRMAMGYNHDSWSLRFSVAANRTYVSFSEKERFGFDTGSFQFTFIKRLGKAPILDKIPF